MKMCEHPRPVCMLTLLSSVSNGRCQAADPALKLEHCYALRTGPVWRPWLPKKVLLVNLRSRRDNCMDALRRLTQKPVRWMVATDYRFALSTGAVYFRERGAVLLTSQEQAEVLSSLPGGDSTPAAADRLIFGNQVRLFPGGVEVRIFGVRKRAHSGGDVVVFVPSDKVVAVGRSLRPELLISMDPGGRCARMDRA
jgi:hypothetical protein